MFEFCERFEDGGNFEIVADGFWGPVSHIDPVWHIEECHSVWGDVVSLGSGMGHRGDWPHGFEPWQCEGDTETTEDGAAWDIWFLGVHSEFSIDDTMFD